MTAPEASRLEISASVRYPRAVGGPEEIVATEPARATFGAPGDHSGRTPTAADRAEQVWLPTPSAEERSYPLRARRANLRRKYHRQHAAAGTPREELAVLVDYVRSCLGSADTAGMRSPRSAAKVRAAIDALRDAGDTLTDDMHNWSPS